MELQPQNTFFSLYNIYFQIIFIVASFISKTYKTSFIMYTITLVDVKKNSERNILCITAILTN